MANNKKVMSAISKMLHKMKALDEVIPEELAEDALEMTEEVKEALEEDGCETKDEEIEKEEEKEEVKDENEVITKEEVEKKVEDAFVKVLRKYGFVKDAALEELDELEGELERKIESEEEEKDEIESEEEVTVDPEEINAKDSAIEILRKVKPAIASIKDAKQRKLVADSLAKALRLSTGTSNQYTSVYNIVKSNSKDSKPSESNYNLGEEWAKRYNPHYKKEVE